MKTMLSLAAALGLSLATFGLSSAPASAMRAVGQAAVGALANDGAGLVEARVVCGPRGCFRTGPRPFYRGGYGYRRPGYGFRGRGYGRGMYRRRGYGY